MPAKPKQLPTRSPAAEAARVEVASLVGGVSLLVVASGLRLADGNRARARLVVGDKSRRLTGTRVGLSTNGSGRAADLLVLSASGRGGDLILEGKLVLEAKDEEVELEPSLAEAAVPVDRLAADHLTKFDDGTRAALLEKVTGAVRRGKAAPAKVASELRALRDQVRPRLPMVAVDPSADYAAQVEGLWRLSSSAFYIKGWIYQRGVQSCHLRVVTPEGRTVDIGDRAYRHPRHDVSQYFGCSPRDRLGFIAYFETPEESPLGAGWILEGGRHGAPRVEVEVPEVIDDADAARTLLFGDLEAERLPEDSLRRHHIRPALVLLEERRSSEIAVDVVDQYGAPPVDPEVSIVVPLYRKLEYIEWQIAQFVHDPEIRAADLIYVLDSPEDADHLRFVAEQLVPLYGVPFRVATLTANGGFAVVNNLGASLARGRKLLLLNSDVVPDKPGWLSQMVEFYDANPQVGALGPKLLYEDDSIQHAGLYFDRPAGAPVWSNEHYFKGMHRDFPKANVGGSVPAVTGACMLIDLELYRSMGGLRGMFIRGDYEDSDLCLRLRDIGREAWYLPTVELYHLEGQSYPTKERALTSDYNKWLHTSLWESELAADSGVER